MVSMDEFLLNKEDLLAPNSSNKTEDEEKQDYFSCLNNQKTENRAQLNSRKDFLTLVLRDMSMLYTLHMKH